MEEWLQRQLPLREVYTAMLNETDDTKRNVLEHKLIIPCQLSDIFWADEKGVDVFTLPMTTLSMLRRYASAVRLKTSQCDQKDHTFKLNA